MIALSDRFVPFVSVVEEKLVDVIRVEKGLGSCSWADNITGDVTIEQDL